MDGTLQLVRDGEADDSEGLFVPLAPFIKAVLDLPAYSVSDFGLLVFCDFSLVLGNSLWTWMFTSDDLPNFLLRKQHAALEGPILVIVLSQLFDPISASIGILG